MYCYYICQKVTIEFERWCWRRTRKHHSGSQAKMTDTRQDKRWFELPNREIVLWVLRTEYWTIWVTMSRLAVLQKDDGRWESYGPVQKQFFFLVNYVCTVVLLVRKPKTQCFFFFLWPTTELINHSSDGAKRPFVRSFNVGEKSAKCVTFDALELTKNERIPNV